MLTPEQRKLRARHAAQVRWSKENGRRNAERGQRGLLDRFLREVDAHAAAAGETLTEDERYRRAESARRAHMTKLAFLSSKARSSGGEAAA